MGTGHQESRVCGSALRYNLQIIWESLGAEEPKVTHVELGFQIRFLFLTCSLRLRASFVQGPALIVLRPRSWGLLPLPCPV